MAREVSHEEIAERFVQAKAVDYAAMGKLIAELGPLLAVSDRGWHGVNFGRFNSFACFMPAEDLNRAVGLLGRAALTSAALEASLGASRPI